MSMAIHDERDRELADLVRGLDNLQWNVQVQAEIMGLGARAVPALVQFLHEPTGQFPDGKVLAAEALGRLSSQAALDGLIAALDPRRLDQPAPVLRLSEETVQDAVARQLGRIGNRCAVPALIEALRRHHLIGAGEALLQFREERALPWLVEGLEDAFKRPRLAGIIRGLGPAAIGPLIETLSKRRWYAEEELLPSLERRATALRLLGELAAKEALPHMREALTDPSDVVRMEAAVALGRLAEGDAGREAGHTLLAGLTHPDFLQRDRCVDALVRIGPAAIPFIERALAEGGVMVIGEAVPLTVNARLAALAALERLKGQTSC